MLKFFRHIRQSLLIENKFSKYILYAIGEIILVVIGILIALQINNWNTARQNNITNTKLLEKLKIELQQNITRLNYLNRDNAGYTQLIKNNDSVLTILSKGATPEDIDLLVKRPYVSNTLNLNSSTYEEMKNTGRLYSLGADSLLNAIEMYYRLCERESYYVTMMNAEVRSQIIPDINKGQFKARQDLIIIGRAFAIKDNPWLFDKSSEEYNALRRQIGFANSYLENVNGRINRLIEASEELKIKIEDAL